MKKSENHPLQSIFPNSSQIAYGCMGLGGDWSRAPFTPAHIKQAHEVVDVALENGITFFDHADIYTMGKAEEVFGAVLKDRPELKDEIVIQSKCGIRFETDDRPKCFDFSKEWILESVDGILQRLGVESIDCLLLHRPDPLMEPNEIAEAFDQIRSAGKVRYFGVSNMSHFQMDYLQAALDEALVVNQIELSLNHLAWLEEGVTGGCSNHAPVNFAGGTLQYCDRNHVQVQSWSPLAQGLFSGKKMDGQPKHIQETARVVLELSQELSVSREAIVIAWLLRYPINIQPVIGTTHLDRIRACCEATNFNLSREQWYRLYNAARGNELP